MQRMHHLFTPEGEAALSAVLRLRPLMAFDFDGTLAPIVTRPDDARVSLAVAARLKALTERLPVAIVTGRSVANVRDRLGFTPHFIVGSHGAEDDSDPEGTQRRVTALDGLRLGLQQAAEAVSNAGVQVEDKGASLALHFRLARDREAALTFIKRLLAPIGPDLQVFGGKMVVNIIATGAPDKAEAVRRLLTRSDAEAAFFAGDDLNDEPVFEEAPAHWLTLRVGRDDYPSKAHFCLEGPQEMALLLERVLAQLPGPPSA